MKIILASGSPRRKQILEKVGLDFSVIVSSYEEQNSEKDPVKLVKKHSLGKARDVYEKICGKNKDALVIGSDVIVFYEDEIIGKPKDADDVRETLRKLSGKKHKVICGVAVIYDGKEYLDYDSAEVDFNKLSDEIIEAYIKTKEPFGKAGSYMMQGKASLFIKEVKGDYFSVIGLPLFKLVRMLDKLGVKIL